MTGYTYRRKEEGGKKSVERQKEGRRKKRKRGEEEKKVIYLVSLFSLQPSATLALCCHLHLHLFSFVQTLGDVFASLFLSLAWQFSWGHAMCLHLCVPRAVLNAWHTVVLQ